MRTIPVTTDKEMADAIAVRFEVFVDEQGVSPDSECDSIDVDPRTLHVLAYDDDDVVVGTCRLIAPHSDPSHGPSVGFGNMDPALPHIGRLSVRASARRTGVGRTIMVAMEAHALARYGGGRRVRVELSAQESALPFYKKLGYTFFGTPYLDEGILHHDAFKIIVPASSRGL